jgi:hypothetical protein
MMGVLLGHSLLFNEAKPDRYSLSGRGSRKQAILREHLEDEPALRTGNRRVSLDRRMMTKRVWIHLLTLLLAACAAPPPPEEVLAGDYYGLRFGLEKTFQARFPFAGKSLDTPMKKRVVKELPCPHGRGALVEIELPPVLAGNKMVPVRRREIIAGTEAGFGYYELKGEPPEEVDPNSIQIELHKPLKVGAIWGDRAQGTDARLEAFEEVNVKAGTFPHSARVRIRYPDDSTITLWFAPRVGMVKGVSSMKGADGRPLAEYELLSYRGLE